MDKIITLIDRQIDSLEAKYEDKDIVSVRVDLHNISAVSDSVSELYSSLRRLGQFRISSNKASERLRKHRKSPLLTDPCG